MDWYPTADKLLRDVLGTVLQIDEARKNPATAFGPPGSKFTPEQIAYFAADRQAALARKLAALALAEDWVAVAEQAQQEVDRLRTEACQSTADPAPAVVTASVQEALL